ncbi:hypothetical protein COT75_05165 [Candidatus Beckwithbacteria bacterium CG10_big_fil_rev_8_21_14_0_10_34_10]|uniref:LOG family protein n=1 Tax=Candidatus Beckwithbacteria bacterium CG10_big_fil_rev_8_21_14_0_10_34_10 TaxID=1974495 RepID=A0A2H0WAA1_9BACT|nr:MAG: hypothetical protein COT75_05165 [Candidatus Beckwithbacteria bacterium CG10_big_fil_rev_8_21_14_0_10_34_10]
MQFIKNIAFLGSSESKRGSKLYNQAFKVAKVLASRGYSIVNGGGPGVMDASTQGAKSAKGETLSITFYPQSAPGFEGRYPKNITDKEITTGNYIERTFKLLEHGDIYIIFKGGTGTFSEFAMAWCLARLYYGCHKPFILYGSFWKEIISVFKKHMYVRGEEDKIFKIVKNENEVLKAIDSFEKDFQIRLKKFLAPKGERAFMGGGLGYRGPDFRTDKAK